MKTDKNGFVVFENVREEQEWMRRYMADHPGPWKQCPTCRCWHQSKKKPTQRCAQCPPASQSDVGALMPNRKPGFPTQHIRGSRDRRDWASYH